MTPKSIYSILLFSFTVFSFGQAKPLIVPANINLPKDTIVSNHLIKSLNDFLGLKENPNKENTFVLKEDLLETSLLLDEIKGIEKSGKYNDDNFYKGYLTNVTQLDIANFLIQFSYIGVNESTPILVGSFEILAKQKDNKFYFLSPLKRNTISWQSKKIGNCTFHFKNTLNTKTATEYSKRVVDLDERLKSLKSNMEWYGCNDLGEVLQTIGVKYKLAYNGRPLGTFNANENNTILLVSGENNLSFNSFDPHDLFHDRVRNSMPKTKINPTMVCGYAYVYGGSWGMSWEEILKKFKGKMTSNKNTDWLKLYSEGYNFGDSQEKHLYVTQLINALIAKKVEKEKGFSSVIELLASKNKDTEGFFITLEKVTGINKTNFNESVWKLINES